jgi:hypothetical protein
VALQGSIDTFALDDVLRLVAGTGKTGRLSLHGTRGVGELVVRDGRVVDGAVSTDERVGDLNELVFELLRFEDGDFQFDAVEVEGHEGVEPDEVEGLLAASNELLAEWREIERIVPFAAGSVTLVPEAPHGTVKIDPAQWRLIAAVGTGAGVAQLSERLDASQLATGRILRSLAEAGLVTIDDTAPLPAPAAAVSLDDAPPPAVEAAAVAPSWEDVPPPVGEPLNGSGNGHGSFDTDALFDNVHEPVPGVDVPVQESAVATAAPAVDAAEFARRLAELPPRAAKAVAAAARATSIEERDAALAELDGTGEEVDHEVLLQLLGPVEG